MKFIRIATIAFSVFTLVLTIVFFAWWAMKDRVVFGAEKFDQVKWVQQGATVQTDCKRGDMAFDLQQHVLIPGAQKQAVMALLGRPALEDEGVIEYDLGKCMHVYHAIRIFFDANGRLTQSVISSH
jgi:hypothetical protein